MIKHCIRCKSNNTTSHENWGINRFDLKETFKLNVLECKDCGAISYKLPSGSICYQIYPNINKLEIEDVANNWDRSNKTGGKIL